MPVEKQSGVSFSTPGSYLVFKIMNCSLWTCSKSLMPYSIQFINNYKFLLWPLLGPAFLLFFLSPTEGDDRGWDGWMVSLMRWTWVWVGSGSWWWTGKPDVLQSMGLQRFGHDWATDWTDYRDRDRARDFFLSQRERKQLFIPFLDHQQSWCHW